MAFKEAMTEAPPFDADILIAGGGLAGMTMALACAQGGFKTMVFDTVDPETAVGAAFDGRVSAIAFASCRLYEALGLWDEMAKDAQPINDILVTDGHVRQGASPFFLHFDHREIGDEPLGHLIENRHNRVVLQAAIQANDKIDYRAPVKVEAASVDDFGMTLTLDSGEKFRGRLCIGADGRGSRMREGAGIKTVNWPYKQTGIVTTVHHERDHEGIAQEYFLPSGPFAILPMTGRRASLVWTERPEIAKEILALDDAGFQDELEARFGTYLGPIEALGPKWSYPLTLQLARSYIAPRLALVADAAHGIHPIAGQGLNLGLRDVAALAEVLVDTARLGLDIGALDALERYQRWRRFDNVAGALSMDLLNRVFSNDIGPLRLARDVGLSIVNAVPPARRFFMRQAGGAVGDLPKLMRGEHL